MRDLFAESHTRQRFYRLFFKFCQVTEAFDKAVVSGLNSPSLRRWLDFKDEGVTIINK
jgi:hypothetical protein